MTRIVIYRENDFETHWRNFVKGVAKDIDHNVTLEEGVDAALKSLGATRDGMYCDGTTCISFEDEKMANLFLLRWS